MPDSTRYDESALLLQCAGGDENAFKALFLQWYQLLAGYLFRITESKELTEDLVQEVFLKVWMARESLSGVRHFKSYLLAVSRNHAFDVMKKRLKEQMLRRAWERDTSIGAEADEDTNMYRAALIEAAIDSLPPRRKEVYLLSRHERLTYHEIADRLGISRESVKTHIELATSGISRFIKDHLLESLALIDIFLKKH
ncbi:MAG TPA: sigma-70 family RNA polymerase sigma factor [Puia sp.]|nr:sigma-70 family RNA polymerase sigma factor [Puia sp.]